MTVETRCGHERFVRAVDEYFSHDTERVPCPECQRPNGQGCVEKLFLTVNLWEARDALGGYDADAARTSAEETVESHLTHLRTLGYLRKKRNGDS